MSDIANLYRRVWEKICPCRLNRKNTVLMILCVMCFSLVTWTVVATINPPYRAKTTNQTYVIVDDYRAFKSLNFTMGSVVAKMRAKPTRATPAPRPKKSYYRPIEDGAGKTLCKCICDLNVTMSELVEAIHYMHTKAKILELTPSTTSTTTTTPVPLLN